MKRKPPREQPPPTESKAARRKKAEHDEGQLDEALEETFPSSDPVSVSVPRKEEEWTKEELAEAERKHRQPPPGG